MQQLKSSLSSFNLHSNSTSLPNRDNKEQHVDQIESIRVNPATCQSFPDQLLDLVPTSPTACFNPPSSDTLIQLEAGLDLDCELPNLTNNDPRAATAVMDLTSRAQCTSSSTRLDPIDPIPEVAFIQRDSQDSHVNRADIEFRFPDTTNQADLNISDVASGPEYDWDNPYNQTNSLLESNTSAVVDTASPDDSDLNVLFFNCSGWRLSRQHIEKAVSHYDIHLLALNEHWWRYEIGLNGFQYEACSRARMPYQRYRHEYVSGRPSGGSSILSKVLSHKFLVDAYGMTKMITAGGIFVVVLYWNSEHEGKRHRHYRYIQDLINKGKKVLVMGDMNYYKHEARRIFHQMGMHLLNTDNTQIAHRQDGTPTYHHNDQIWLYRLSGSMVAQHWRHDPMISHESPHALLVFKLSKQLPKLTRTVVHYPSDDTVLERFGIELAKEIDAGVGSKMDIFYDAIYKASTTLKLIKTHKGQGRLKFHWSDEDYQTYKDMLSEAHSYREVDMNLHRQLLRETRVWWMQRKAQQWSNFVASCVANRSHFGLLNQLARRGKVWVNQAPIFTNRDKRPAITDNVDVTTRLWLDHYHELYRLKHVPDIPHLNGLTVEHNMPVFREVDIPFINQVMSTKRSRSSCGPDSLRYGHIKEVMKVRPEFFRDLVNEHLNNTHAPAQWKHCTVIPLYKHSKMGAIDQPSSFRAVVLQSALLKSFESFWVKSNIDRFEELTGPEQHAYVRNRSVGTALLTLHNHMEEVIDAHGGGIVTYFDIKGAFGSCNRNRTFFDLAAKFPGDSFVQKLRHVYNSLVMQIDLGFGDKSDVEVDYLTGNPEGSSASDQIWDSLMGSVIQYVKHPDRCPHARIVLFADDIATVTVTNDELQNIFVHLSKAIAYFCLKFDPTKTKFQRFGLCEQDHIFLFNEFGDTVIACPSDVVRYLGFQIKDVDGISIDFHVSERCSEDAIKYEKRILTWVSNNQQFCPNVRRSILLTRCVPKLFFGLQAIIDCTAHISFKETYGTFDAKGRKVLTGDWHSWPDLDYLNIRVADLAKAMTKGMTVDVLCAGFYNIKCLHAIGQKCQIKDTRAYWYRLVPTSVTWSTDRLLAYVKCNIHIINGILFRKGRLPNFHLLTAILCGHQSKWWRNLGRNEQYTGFSERFNYGWHDSHNDRVRYLCPMCLSPYDDSAQIRHGQCFCNLAIPGSVPKDKPFLPEHYTFIRFLNGLIHHESFQGWKKDNPYPIPDDVLYDNAYLYDELTQCANLFTDGSFQYGRAGWGFFLDDDLGRQARMCGGVAGKRTNNTAELSAIINGIEYCSKFSHRPIHIYTDSMYCIMSLSKFKRYRAQFILESQSLSYEAQNIELIERAHVAIEQHGWPVFLSQVKAHTGGTDYASVGNDIADSLSKMGLDQV